jgi:hypothetical protein
MGISLLIGGKWPMIIAVNRMNVKAQLINPLIVIGQSSRCGRDKIELIHHFSG